MGAHGLGIGGFCVGYVASVFWCGVGIVCCGDAGGCDCGFVVEGQSLASACARGRVGCFVLVVCDVLDLCRIGDYFLAGRVGNG